MTLLLLSLLCTWPHTPAPTATCYAQISGREHLATKVLEHSWVVVISDGVIIRADPEIAHLVGHDWSTIKRECRALNWSVLELPVPQFPACGPKRFRLRLGR